MSSELITTVISSAVVLGAGGLSIWGQLQAIRMNQKLQEGRQQKERITKNNDKVSAYVEPLIQAVHELQSRFYNILEQDFTRYLTNGTLRQKDYFIKHTTFVIMQYFAWAEILLREVQFINMYICDHERQGKSKAQIEHIHEFKKRTEEITKSFRTDQWHQSLMFFAGEQRALGELLIDFGDESFTCKGYATFLSDQSILQNPLTEALMADVQKLDTTLAQTHPRLVALQNSLIELLDHLDKDAIRIDRNERKKVTA